MINDASDGKPLQDPDTNEWYTKELNLNDFFHEESDNLLGKLITMDIGIIKDQEDLIKAIENNESDKAKLLIDKIKDVNYTIEDKIPVFIAVQQDNIDLVKALVEKGANIKDRHKYGDCLLNMAVRCENIDMVKYLLDQGVDPSFADIDGYGPIHIAALRNHKEMFDMLQKLSKHTLHELTSLKSLILCAIVGSVNKNSDNGFMEYLFALGLHENDEQGISTGLLCAGDRNEVIYYKVQTLREKYKLTTEK